MKLIAAMLLSAALLLCGCGAKNTSGEITADPQNLQTDENAAEVKPTIKSGIEKDLGASPSKLKADYGEISSSTWAEGPMYRFGEGDNWYVFADYELSEDGEYSPKGECTRVIMPVYELIDSPDGEYNADVFAEAVGAKISRGYSEMYDDYYFEACADGLKIVIYGDSSGEISENSNAEISEAD